MHTFVSQIGLPNLGVAPEGAQRPRNIPPPLTRPSGQTSRRCSDMPRRARAKLARPRRRAGAQPTGETPPFEDFPSPAALSASPSCKSTAADGADRVPSLVHQIWLGGLTLKWVQLLSLMSVHYLWRPAQHLLHFDREPRSNGGGLEWRCACAFARCAPATVRQTIFGQPIEHRAHAADLLRIDLLEARRRTSAARTL